MRRGELWWANLDPVVGSEANKRRPVVIVSNDDNNGIAQQRERGVITVVPVTSNTARVYAFQVRLRARTGGLSQDSKAQAEQVRSIDVTRLVARIGNLTPAELTALDAALRLHLGL